jgi:uncharacterized protein YjiS (DUF1127 family)
MAVMDHSAVSDAGFVAVTATRIARVAGAVLRYWTNRRQFRRLAEMSDWELADIGIERVDLDRAWKRRIDIDPLRYLGQVARSRGTVEDAARRVF